MRVGRYSNKKHPLGGVLIFRRSAGPADQGFSQTEVRHSSL